MTYIRNLSLLFSLLAFLLPAAQAAGTSYPANAPIAVSKCASGKGCTSYTGFLLKKKKFGIGQDVDAYLGIQYATANRWEAPLPVKTRSGRKIRARKYGPVCPQVGVSETNEQCLYLNVWAPANAKNLPVMVFIYGGAFLSGAGSLPLYDGSRMAGWKNAVVVTLNYRLGILGFFHNDPLTNGNYGIMDQGLAMKWVHDNIANFGGDPENVTLVGESAGSMSVTIHLLDPEVQGLFKRGIVESPYYGIPTYNQDGALLIAEASKKLARTICTRFKDSECDPKKMDVRRLIATEAALQLLPIGASYHPFLYAPYVGKQGPLREQLLDGVVTKPAIIGNNEYESTMFVDNAFSKGLARVKSYDSLVKLFTNGEIPKLQEFKDIGRYNPDKMPGAKPLDRKIQALDNLMNDADFFCSTRHVLNNSYEKGNANLYSYAFNQVTNYNPLLPVLPACDDEACHADELAYVFDNPKVYFRSEEQILSEQMQSYWSNFFTDGKPGTVDGGDWEPYLQKGEATGKRYVLLAGKKNEYEYDQDHHCDFWENYLYKTEARPEEAAKEIKQEIDTASEEVKPESKSGLWDKLLKRR